MSAVADKLREDGGTTDYSGDVAEAVRLVGNWLEPGRLAPGYYEGQAANYETRQAIRVILAALAKARRCPDGECTEKCANGGAA